MTWSATTASPRSQDKHGFLDDPVQQCSCPDRQSSQISALATHQHPEDVPIAKKNRWRYVWVALAVPHRRDTILMYTWDGEKIRPVPNLKEDSCVIFKSVASPDCEEEDAALYL